MKRLLLSLIGVLVLPTAVNAEIDKDVAEFCLKAKDFAGCVKTMKSEDKSEDEVDLLANKFVGIGVVLSSQEIGLITSVVPNGPAEKVKIKAKDKILSIDNLSIKGMDMNEVKKLLRGERGTKVSLKIAREGLVIYKTLVREFIDISPSKDFLLNLDLNLDDDDLKTKFLKNSKKSIFEYDKDAIYFNGKRYESSRKCPEGERMRWQVDRKLKNLYKKKVKEIGCMTDKEEESYWREYNMRRDNRK